MRRREMLRHARAAADARDRWQAAAARIGADQLGPASGPVARTIAMVAYRLAPFMAAVEGDERAKAAALAHVPLMLPPDEDESQRQAVAELVAVHRFGDVGPPPSRRAVETLHAAPRPGPMAVLAA